MLAAVAVGLAACGDTEEIAPIPTATTTSPAVSATPGTTPGPSVPSDLPPAAEGYTWYLTPANGAFDYGLPLYALQLPAGWTHPGPFYGNPLPFQAPGASDLGPTLTVRLTPTAATAGADSLFLNRVVGQHSWVCAALSGPVIQSAFYAWESYSFACPADESGACEASDSVGIHCEPFDLAVPISVYRGRGATTNIAGYVVDIWIEQPEGSAPLNAELEKALESFAVR